MDIISELLNSHQLSKVWQQELKGIQIFSIDAPMQSKYIQAKEIEANNFDRLLLSLFNSHKQCRSCVLDRRTRFYLSAVSQTFSKFWMRAAPEGHVPVFFCCPWALLRGKVSDDLLVTLFWSRNHFKYNLCWNFRNLSFDVFLVQATTSRFKVDNKIIAFETFSLAYTTVLHHDIQLFFKEYRRCKGKSHE